MFCEQCGMKLEEDTRFCPGCGCKVGDDVIEAAGAVKDNGPDMNGQNNGANMNGHYSGPDMAGQHNGSEAQVNWGGQYNGSEAQVNRGGQYNGSEVQVNPGGNIPNWSPNPKKPKKTMILIAAAAVMFLVVGTLAVVLAMTFLGGPKMKVTRAVASTMKDTPKLVNDLKVVPSVLTADQYTAGVELEIADASVKAEFRNAKNDKQVSMNADIYDYGDIDLLYGVHSGVLKASLSDLNYIFFYDPKADNDGFLCEQIREQQLDMINEILEDITSDKASIETLRKNFSNALAKELKELEFREARTHRFEIDGKDRECKGYKIRINEKNIVHVLEYMGEATEELSDILDDLCYEIESEEFETDITFYIYKSKLAAIIVSVDDGEEVYIAFQGGEYRMQNISVGAEYDGDDYEMFTISTRRNSSREVIEIEGDGVAEICITYDTKSGNISCEYDDGWSSYSLAGVYKHSNSEASFTLQELEYGGESMMDDIRFTMFVKKKADIEKYEGEEFDLGSADQEDFEDLLYELEDYAELFDGMRYLW